MTKRPKVLLGIGLPLLVAGLIVTVGGMDISPWWTLLFPCGVFLLGVAGISFMTHPEFDRFDSEHDWEGGAPGDHQTQHVLIPEKEPHHAEAHAH